MASKWLSVMANIPDLMARSRTALNDYPLSTLTCLDLICEMNVLREECIANIESLRDHLTTFDEGQLSAELVPHIHALHLKSLGMALATGIVLDRILGAFVSSKTALREEACRWSEEIVRLAGLAAKYRPLSSMSLAVSLCIACLGASNADTEAKTVALYSEYQQACLGRAPKDSMKDLECLRKRLTFREIETGLDTELANQS